jgi:hypothetical protein
VFALFGEPLPEDYTSLNEPGYRIREDGTVVDMEGKPLSGEAAAEALALAGEPSAPELASLDEPGYHIRDNGTIADLLGAPDEDQAVLSTADVFALFGEPLPEDYTSLDEPGYHILEDGTITDMEGKPLSGKAAAEALALMGEPPAPGLASLDEPGYHIREDGTIADLLETSDEDQAVLDDADVFALFGEPLPKDYTALDEPGYHILEDGSIVDAGAKLLTGAELMELLGESATERDLFLDEPGYRILEDGTVVDMERKPLSGAAAEALALAGEPSALEEAALDEPGYHILEDGTIDDAGGKPLTSAELMELFGESATEGDLFLNEPGYHILEDGTFANAKGKPLTDMETELADAMALLGESSAIGDLMLDEPGYLILEDGTIADAAGIPLRDSEGILTENADAITLGREPPEFDNGSLYEPEYSNEADVATFLGELETAGETALDEPGYIIKEEKYADGAGETFGVGSGEDFDTGPFAEPGYLITEYNVTGTADEDGSLIADKTASGVSGIPAAEPDTAVMESAGDAPYSLADVAYTDPGEHDELFVFTEPGYSIREDNADAGLILPDSDVPPTEFLVEPGYHVSKPDAIDVAAHTGSTEEGWNLNEPAYTGPQVDAGFEHLEYPPQRDGSNTDESRYLVVEHGEGELATGIGDGVSAPNDMPATAARPENTEYFAENLAPDERMDFPFNEPAVSLVENVRVMKPEEGESPSAFTPAIKIERGGAVFPSSPASATGDESNIHSAALVEAMDSLEGGKYYVQIGGYASMERIESVMRELGGVYPLVIMGNRYILIGPLNEGESNALELQFRAKGFANAFVVLGKTLK